MGKTIYTLSKRNEISIRGPGKGVCCVRWRGGGLLTLASSCPLTLNIDFIDLLCCFPCIFVSQLFHSVVTDQQERKCG